MKIHDVKQESRYNDRIQCRICKKSFKTIGWSHLLQKHGLTTTEYREGFHVDFFFSDQNRKDISDRFSRKQTRDSYKPRTRAEIIRDIQRYARQNSSITYTWLKERAPKLLTQTKYMFGSWKTIQEAVHIKSNYPHWSHNRIILEIHKRLSKDLDVNVESVENEDLRLYNAGCYYFGSWRKAIEASDIKYWKVRKNKPRTRETVARDLVTWVKEHGPLNTTSILNSNVALYDATRNKYGSLEKAASVLRLPYFCLKKKWSQDRIMEEIRLRASKGHSIRLSTIEKEDYSLYKAALSHFGGWGNAIEACGFDYDKIKWDRFHKSEKVVHNLRSWVKEHGPLNAKDLKTNNSPLYQATKKLFCSIEEAAHILGLPFYRRHRCWSKNIIIKEIKRRDAEGYFLNAKSVRKEDTRLFDAAYRYFGFWGNAVKASGFDYSRIIRGKNLICRNKND